MREQLANFVYPVLQQGLRLKAQAERKEALDLAKVQAGLRGSGLQAEILEGDPPGEGDRFLGPRYALVSWLDEIFIDSPWADDWTDHKLEEALYQSNDRAWKFWEQARLAEARGNGDALEVFFLCVMLGFRGTHRDDPARLQAWREAVESQIAEEREEFSLPPALEPPINVPTLSGARRKQRLVLAAMVSLLVLTPLAVFFLLTRL